MSPKHLNSHGWFVQLDYSVQNKLHKCMKTKIFFGNCYWNNPKCFRHIWPRWSWQWP